MAKKESKELKFIKGFSSTSVNRICNELNLDRSNLIHNRYSDEKVKQVYNKLVLELTEMIKDIIKEN